MIYTCSNINKNTEDSRMSKHTPEPWHVGGNGVIVYDEQSWGVASAVVFHGRQEPQTSEANARRIVACVNACAGASTDVLERGAVHDWSLLMTGLEAQRNDLLYALSLITELAEGHLAPNTLANIATIARGAVEKVSSTN
jgi:hypothetical protein